MKKSALQDKSSIPFPFALMLIVNISFLILAFMLDAPANIFKGFLKILASQSILITDYIEVGGFSATLLNVASVGLISVLVFIFSGIKPNGGNIMALWITAGFAFFGKNLLNMLPLILGVWLFAKYNKQPFSNYIIAALLVSTISPVISEITFLGVFSRPVEVVMGITMGFFMGFIFPVMSAEMLKVHSGYDLYNMGFAGGLIATILATGFRSAGIDIHPSSSWSSGNNTMLAIFLYLISLALFCCGFVGGIKKNLEGFRNIFSHSGRLISDFYYLYENSVYINMSVLCAFSTTLVLVLGADLNGPVIAGIFTIVAFGSFGKHLKNIVPIVIGAIISVYVNRWDLVAPSNILAILFSTGLAPIAGQFGWFWGLIAGFLHVNVANYIGYLNSGLNLYNNGFAAGFVALFLLPLITIFRKNKEHYEKG